MAGKHDADAVPKNCSQPCDPKSHSHDDDNRTMEPPWSNVLQARQPKITFENVWGPCAWLVTYDGVYDNKRQPHVALRYNPYQGDYARDALYRSMTPGVTCCLSNLRKSGEAVMWDVEGLGTVDGRKPHFTVHYGSRQAEEFRSKPFWNRNLQ